MTRDAAKTPEAAGSGSLSRTDAGHPIVRPPIRQGSLCVPSTSPAPRVEALPATPIAAAGTGVLLPASFAPGSARWTWLNFWAAWCIPCREEMPLVRHWVTRLQERGTSVDLVFVSLDDDERQLRQFLDRAQGALPRATEWMQGSAARTRWLRNVGLRDPTPLPVHVVVNPSGNLACTIRGAIEEGDFDEFSRLFTERGGGSPPH